MLSDTYCSECGKPIGYKVYPNYTCQGCYEYFHRGGTINELPEKGVIAYDSRGYVVCHICGRAYRRLGSHIRESHGMTISKYKEQFGLCSCSKTTENTYSLHMRDLAYKYDMPRRLSESGKKTRIQVGETQFRSGKEVRLQECLDKRRRKRS